MSAEELAAAKEEVNQTAAKAQNEIAAAQRIKKGLIKLRKMDWQTSTLSIQSARFTSR